MLTSYCYLKGLTGRHESSNSNKPDRGYLIFIWAKILLFLGSSYIRGVWSTLGMVHSRIGRSRNGRVRNGRSRIGRSRIGTSTIRGYPENQL